MARFIAVGFVRETDFFFFWKIMNVNCKKRIFALVIALIMIFDHSFTAVSAENEISSVIHFLVTEVKLVTDVKELQLIDDYLTERSDKNEDDQKMLTATPSQKIVKRATNSGIEKAEDFKTLSDESIVYTAYVKKKLYIDLANIFPFPENAEITYEIQVPGPYKTDSNIKELSGNRYCFILLPEKEGEYTVTFHALYEEEEIYREVIINAEDLPAKVLTPSIYETTDSESVRLSLSILIDGEPALVSEYFNEDVANTKEDVQIHDVLYPVLDIETDLNFTDFSDTEESDNCRYRLIKDENGEYSEELIQRPSLGHLYRYILETYDIDLSKEVYHIIRNQEEPLKSDGTSADEWSVFLSDGDRIQLSIFDDPEDGNRFKELCSVSEAFSLNKEDSKEILIPLEEVFILTPSDYMMIEDNAVDYAEENASLSAEDIAEENNADLYYTELLDEYLMPAVTITYEKTEEGKRFIVLSAEDLDPGTYYLKISPVKGYQEMIPGYIRICVTGNIVGDIDRDGEITAKDAELCYMYVNGAAAIEEEDLFLLDVDGNEKVNARDAAMIYARVNGVIDIFPVETEDEVV